MSDGEPAAACVSRAAVSLSRNYSQARVETLQAQSLPRLIVLSAPAGEEEFAHAAQLRAGELIIIVVVLVMWAGIFISAKHIHHSTQYSRHYLRGRALPEVLLGDMHTLVGQSFLCYFSAVVWDEDIVTSRHFRRQYYIT